MTVEPFAEGASRCSLDLRLDRQAFGLRGSRLPAIQPGVLAPEAGLVTALQGILRIVLNPRRSNPWQVDKDLITSELSWAR